MMLPNGARAVIPIEKLRDYCLSRTHPVGKHKARVFEAALGWTVGDAQLLQQLLHRAAATQEATPTERTEFGQKYEVRLTVIGLLGLVEILSAWIILDNEDFPRLTTCYAVS